MREREKRGLSDGGDRTSTIARWLRQRVRSERVTELVLTAWSGDEDPDVLARYNRADAEGVADLAPELSSLIQDYADDAGRPIQAQLAWVTAEGAPWTSKRLRGRCAKDKEAEIVGPMDGSPTEALAQSMRHTEAAYQANIEMIRATARERESADARWATMFEQSQRMNERLITLLEQAQNEVVEATEELEEATAVAEEASAAAEEAMSIVEDARGSDRLAQVIEIAAKQLTGG